MARVLITGSSDGLGLLAARLLVQNGDRVTLHARNEQRAADARAALPEAEHVVIGDLSTIAAMEWVAEQANSLGRYDAVIHNAAVGYREPVRVETADGLPQVLAVNALAPYVLTALMERPDRLVYLSSSLHRRCEPDLGDLLWTKREWDGRQAYSETKLFDAALSGALARRWTDVRSNAVEPGWVPTKMGGPDARDDLALGPVTQVWLATSDDPAARQSGGYFCHQQLEETHPLVVDPDFHEQLISAFAAISGIDLL